MTIALTFIIPIIVAILLMEMPPRVMRWMMLLWFLPISSIASTVLWRYVYDNQLGIFEYIATDVLHLPQQLFLNDPNQVLFWLVFPGILLFGPGLIYMATLQGIPSSYYEAAEIEGAGFWRKIWTISFPRLRPVISVLLTFAIIASLQEFNWPYFLTNGEPEGASRTIVMYMYSYIQNFRYSDATALAIYLFVTVMVIVIIFRTFFKEDPDA
jgi:multiple sugar transport system permease protein